MHPTTRAIKMKPGRVIQRILRAWNILKLWNHRKTATIQRSQLMFKMSLSLRYGRRSLPGYHCSNQCLIHNWQEIGLDLQHASSLFAKHVCAILLFAFIRLVSNFLWPTFDETRRRAYCPKIIWHWCSCAKDNGRLRMIETSESDS